MIYIVSGFQRTGSSMMMRSLVAGGLEPAFSARKDARMHEKYGEETNPGGYFELDLEDIEADDFPERYEGRLVKYLSGLVVCLPPAAEYRIAFMRRKAEQIKRSMLKRFGYYSDVLDDEKRFQRTMRNICDCLRDRRSVLSVTEVWMNDAVKRPEREFGRLKFDGWPIDVKKAAEVPQQKLMRFR